MYEGLYDTRKGLTDKDAEIVGTMTAKLLLPWDQWVHRRVERITFCDEDAVRRNVSIDFTLPSWFHRGRDTPEQDAIRQLVPLSFLRKGVLANFSLQDESNISLPLLTALQNAQVAEAILWVLAQEALSGASLTEKARNRIKCDIRNLVRESANESDKTYFRLFHDRDVAWNARLILDRNVTFSNMAQLFRSHFLALSMLPIARQQRRVLNFSYEESVWDDDQLSRTKAFRRAVAIAAGKPRRIGIASSSASEADSFHFEIEAPEGLMITARRSYYRLEDGTRVERHYTEGSIQRAHFHFTNILSRSRVNVILYLRPRRSTIVRGAVLTALLSMIATLVITFRLPSENGGGGEIATTILLAATGVIGLVVVRSGEDQMATSLLFPLRLLATAPVALAVLAALVIAAHPSSELFSRVALSIVSLLMAICVFLLARNWYFVRKVQTE